MEITKDQMKRISKDIQDGCTIEEAAKNIGMNRKEFYRYVTAEQKKELKTIKAAQSKAFGGSRKLHDEFMTFFDEM